MVEQEETRNTEALDWNETEKCKNSLGEAISRIGKGVHTSIHL